MSVRRFDLEAGGDSFSFKQETEPKIAFWMSKYPEDRKRSAVIPLLWLAQKDNHGWLSEPAMREVAERVGMSYIRVYEVATFYTMFNMEPVGTYHVQLCGTTPCMLRGAEKLKAVCERKIGPKGSVSDDGKLSWVEVECLGACVNAPMAQINDYYYEDLDEESLETVLDEFVAGKNPEPGPRVYRQTSAPEGGLTTLLDEMLYDGSRAEPLKVIPGAPEPKPEDVAPEPEPASPVAVEKPPAAAPVAAPAGDAGDDEAPTASFGATRSFDRNPAAKASDKAVDVAASDKAGAAPKAAVSLEDVARPVALAAPGEAGKDDLKRISGIGPKIEGTLNALGVYHFSQIAAWTPDNASWVDGYLSFRGRIDREKWIEQAAQLASGANTDFSKRVDAGRVPTSEKKD